MSGRNDICKFNECNEPALENSEEGYCIFHERGEKDINEFKKRLDEKIQQGDYDFTGYCFPIVLEFTDKTFESELCFNEAIFKEGLSFFYVKFEKKVKFRKAKFKKRVDLCSIFKEGADFSGSIFEGNVDFKATFEKYTSFNNVIFKQNVWFRRYFPRKSTISLSRISGPCKKWGECPKFDPVYYEGIKCKREIPVPHCKKYKPFIPIIFKSGVDFYGAVFEDQASFSNIGFCWYHTPDGGYAQVRFENCTFNGNAFFDNTYFKGEVNFNESTFKKLANFENTVFEDRVLFYGANFQEADFTGVKFEKDYEGGEHAFRLAKVTQQGKGDYQKAGDFYYQEMEYKRKKIREKIKSSSAPLKRPYTQDYWYKKFFKLSFGFAYKKLIFLVKWFRYVFPFEVMKVLCGYGEKPRMVIVSSIVIIIVWALLYSLLKTITPLRQSFWSRFTDSVYFSLVTFTTLGYGDIVPESTLGRILSGAEGFIGGFMMALFVLVLSKRWTR